MDGLLWKYGKKLLTFQFPAYLMSLLLCICLPVRTDVMAVMTTDMTTEGPVMWQAANPTTKYTAIDQNPARPVLKSRCTSGHVVCLTCLITTSDSRSVAPDKRRRRTYKQYSIWILQWKSETFFYQLKAVHLANSKTNSEFQPITTSLVSLFVTILAKIIIYNF